MFINQQEIDAIRQEIAGRQEPWSTAFDAAIARANSALGASPQSVVDNGGPCNDSNVHKFSTDGIDSSTGRIGDRGDYFAAIAMSDAILDLGIGYSFSDSSAFAEKAIALLYHWAVDPQTYMEPINRNTSPSTCGVGSQWSIEIMITAPSMIYAADLLWNYPGWDPVERAAFAQWASDIGYSAMGQDGGYYNNGENWRLVLESTAGALNDDDVLLEHAFARHRLAWDGITRNGQDGQILNVSGCVGCGALTWERNRSTGLEYSTYALNAMTATAEIARHRGVDLYNYKTAAGWGLELVLDYHDEYVANPSTWPWRQERSYDGATQNAALYELAYLWKQDSGYLAAINRWGSPMYDIRVMGPTTLTHAFGAYPWEIHVPGCAGN